VDISAHQANEWSKGSAKLLAFSSQWHHDKSVVAPYSPQAEAFSLPPQADENFFRKMKQPANDAPLVLVKWYAYAKWILERVESFPKSQRFILGQRLSNHVMDVLETLVKASYAKDKTALLNQANEGIEMTRWVVRMASDRKLLAPKQFEFSALQLNECGRMVGGWLKSRGGGFPPPSPA
jgi:hypothetical protein